MLQALLCLSVLHPQPVSSPAMRKSKITKLMLGLISISLNTFILSLYMTALVLIKMQTICSIKDDDLQQCGKQSSTKSELAATKQKGNT